MKMMMVIDFGDLLSYAETQGESWNGAHELFVDNNMYVGSIDRDYCDPSMFGSNPRACELLKGFMDKYKLKEMYIKAKNAD